MKAFRLSLPHSAAAALLLSASLGSLPAQAEKPVWVPIAELLVSSLSESDPVRMSDVMTRCTALNMILAGMAATESSEDAERYQNEAKRLIQNAVLLDSRLVKELTGAEADIPSVSDATIAEVKGHVSGYNDWLDDNMAKGNSWFNRDFELEMESCSLASRFIAQMSGF